MLGREPTNGCDTCRDQGDGNGWIHITRLPLRGRFRRRFRRRTSCRVLVVLASSAALDVRVRGAHARADERSGERRVATDLASFLLNGLLLRRRSRGCRDEGSRSDRLPVDPVALRRNGLFPCGASCARLGQPRRVASDCGARRIRGRRRPVLRANRRRGRTKGDADRSRRRYRAQTNRRDCRQRGRGVLRMLVFL